MPDETLESMMKRIGVWDDSTRPLTPSGIFRRVQLELPPATKERYTPQTERLLFYFTPMQSLVEVLNGNPAFTYRSMKDMGSGLQSYRYTSTVPMGNVTLGPGECAAGGFLTTTLGHLRIPHQPQSVMLFREYKEDPQPVIDDLIKYIRNHMSHVGAQYLLFADLNTEHRLTEFSPFLLNGTGMHYGRTLDEINASIAKKR